MELSPPPPIGPKRDGPHRSPFRGPGQGNPKMARLGREPRAPAPNGWDAGRDRNHKRSQRCESGQRRDLQRHGLHEARVPVRALRGRVSDVELGRRSDLRRLCDDLHEDRARPSGLQPVEAQPRVASWLLRGHGRVGADDARLGSPEFRQLGDY